MNKVIYLIILHFVLAFQISAQSPAIRYMCGYEETEIKATPKGNRPLPGEYLDTLYILRHIEAFSEGASYLLPKDILDRFGRERLGRIDGQFVMPKSEMDGLLQKAAGNLEVIERELGIPQGAWRNREIVRIDVLNPSVLHLRMASGNEAGTNELWLPGGFLPTGYKEAICDQIPLGTYTETTIKLQ